MPLTPIDIVNRQFTRSRSGVSAAEVEEFLREAARDLEHALAESLRLQQRMEEMEREIERFQAMESTLKEALILAQATATETRALAQREADAVLRDAQVRADEIRRDAVWHSEAMRQERLRFGWEFRALLQSQLDHLDAELQRASTPLESHGWPVMHSADYSTGAGPSTESNVARPPDNALSPQLDPSAVDTVVPNSVASIDPAHGA